MENFEKAAREFDREIGIRSYNQAQFKTLAEEIARRYDNVFVTVNDFTATFYDKTGTHIRRVSL